MDSEVIEGAKKVADERKVSLSRLVADFFNALRTKELSTEIDEIPPKTRALHGALRHGPEIDAKKDYREFLEEKYS
jgi:hypothetical protein